MLKHATGLSKHVKVYRPKSEQDAHLSRAAHMRALSWQEWLVLLATIVASSGSIGLSFEGTAYNLERDGGAIFSTTAAALIATVTIGVFQIIGWYILLDTRHYDSALKKAGGGLIALAFLFFGYGTSSYFNYASITAPSATIIYRSDQVEQLASAMDVLRRQSEASSQLLPLIEAEEQAGCSAAKLEAASGAYSGSRGKGRVSGVLDGICQRASAAAKAMRAAVAANEANAKQADLILAGLETLLSDTRLSLLERERRITAGVRELEAIIRKIRKARMVESAEAFFKTLTTSVAALGGTGGSGLQARQNLALRELRQGFTEREPIIAELVAKIASENVPEVAMDARPSVHEMLWYSADKHPQNVLVAMGIDSFALFMLLALTLKQPSASNNGPRNSRSRGARGLDRSRDIPASLLEAAKKSRS